MISNGAGHHEKHTTVAHSTRSNITLCLPTCDSSVMSSYDLLVYRTSMGTAKAKSNLLSVVILYFEVITYEVLSILLIRVPLPCTIALTSLPANHILRTQASTKVVVLLRAEKLGTPALPQITPTRLLLLVPRHLENSRVRRLQHRRLEDFRQPVQPIVRAVAP